MKATDLNEKLTLLKKAGLNIRGFAIFCGFTKATALNNITDKNPKKNYLSDEKIQKVEDGFKRFEELLKKR